MLSSSRRRRARQDSAFGITTAEGSHLDDIDRRQRQYIATMVFRIVAIMVVVFVPGLTLLERVVIGIVATVIPYFAVIRANAGPDNAADPTNLMIGGPRQGELPGPDRGIEGRARPVNPDDDVFRNPADGEAGEEDEVIYGHVVHEDDSQDPPKGGAGPAADAADHVGHSDPDSR